MSRPAAPVTARINNDSADEVVNFRHSSPKPGELIRAVDGGTSRPARGLGINPREAGEEGR